MSKKTNFIFLKFLVICFSVYFAVSLNPLRAFGKKGPHTHTSITQEAFGEFMEKADWDLRLDCMELIVQGNLRADSAYMNNDAYHCDNNNILGCADRFRTLKDDAYRETNYITGLMKLGMALHIAQDFYSHSNWAENYPLVGILAPIEHPWVFLSLKEIQTGYYNLLPIVDHTEEAGHCFDAEEGLNGHYTFATHACLNKDAADSHRSLNLVLPGVPISYHDWAASLAKEHTVQILLEQFKDKNPHLLTCLTPKVLSFSCGGAAYNFLRQD
ncbi:hypothetical protein [Leptospira sarikeiensis]|uniref:VWA7 N-terminal domain-containing protein n=1 Tax=Leptospira sarikeiensis TaxID=2484943 RepID=A0A4R9KE72_9LEPT|nr:hypothetical protein [Leptospira sarikeiensis]TGL64159.1 hypothetical protein EHQ64_03990 [Leptospira sarikeiensis]